MKQQEQTTGGTPDLRNNEAQSRYELKRDGDVAAQVQYRIEGGTMHMVHTEVDERYEGQGLGSRIAAFALDDAKTRGLKVAPQCRFIAGYIARHEKEYGALVQS